MKKLIWTLSALALTGLCFTACGDDEEECLAGNHWDTVTGQCVADTPVETCEVTQAACEAKGLTLDPEECICVSQNVRKSCDVHEDCEKDQLCDANNECVAAADAGDVYRYVRIDDLSTATTGVDPGADIDAIVLIKKKTSEAKYAKAIKQYKPNEANFSEQIKNNEGHNRNVAGDPNKILEKPDSFTTYTNAVFQSKPNCAYKDADGNFTYVSLGGDGGFIEVQMGGAIENGDRLDVLEVGGCQLTNIESSHAITAEREKIKVQVSVTADSSSWKGNQIFDRHGREEVTDGDFGLLSWTVSGL